MVLGRHVVDFEAAQTSDPAGVTDDGSRLVSMDVDLDRGFVTHDQRRFAPARNLLSDVVDRKMLAIDDELGAVSPPRLG